MSKHIIAALIATVAESCNYEVVLEKSRDLAVKLKAGSVPLDQHMFMLPVSAYGHGFWNDPMRMNCLVATVLEKMTMDIVNPILERVKGTTEDDINAIIRVTDRVQVEVANSLMQELSVEWNPPLTLRHNHQYGGVQEEAGLKTHEMGPEEAMAILMGIATIFGDGLPE